MMLQHHWIQEALAALDGRHVCYIALRGSRLLGVNDPNSDVDLRMIHKDPTTELLGLDQPPDTIEHIFKIKRPDEIDCHDQADVELLEIVSFEVAKFFSLLLVDNGNVIESLHVPEGCFWADRHGDALRRSAHEFLTRRLYKFYRSYAYKQFKRGSSQYRTGKGTVTCYQQMFTGIYVLRHGRYEFNFPSLVRAIETETGFSSAILPTITYDRRVLTEELFQTIQQEYQDLEKLLEEARDASPLPEVFDRKQWLNKLLLKWRSEGWV